MLLLETGELSAQLSGLCRTGVSRCVFLSLRPSSGVSYHVFARSQLLEVGSELVAQTSVLRGRRRHLLQCVLQRHGLCFAASGCLGELQQHVFDLLGKPVSLAVACLLQCALRCFGQGDTIAQVHQLVLMRCQLREQCDELVMRILADRFRSTHENVLLTQSITPDDARLHAVTFIGSSTITSCCALFPFFLLLFLASSAKSTC
jgi:hypothetical protein